MKCEKCGTEYEGEQCPVCAQQVSEAEEPTVETPEIVSPETPVEAAPESPTETAPEEKPTKDKGRLALIIALCVVIVGALVCIIGFTTGWFGGKAEPEATEPSAATSADGADEETTTPSESTQETEAAPFEPVGTGDSTSAAAKAIYAVSDAKPGDANMSAVVATYDGGELKNGELNVFFWMEYYNFMNSYGSYAAYFGLDSESPLYTQASMSPIDENDESKGSMSWEQYFLSAAMQNFKYYKGLELAAQKAGFVVPQSYLDDLDKMISNLESAAKDSGYDDPEAYLQMTFGSGVSLADYKSYYTTFITSYAYYQEVLTPQCAVSDEEAEKYFDEHSDEFTQQNLTKTEVKDRAVRHILIQPEKDIDSDGDGKNDASSDEAKAAAKAKAEQIYDEWKQDPTEEHFAELAKEYTADSNADNGGLYENVYPGMTVQAFNDWVFDENRLVGDNGIVETDFGFHIMYFSAFGDTMQWLEAAREAASSNALSELSQNTAYAETIDFDFSKVVLCDVVSQNVQKTE